MKSYIQSTSNKVFISSKLGSVTVEAKSLLRLDGTHYLKKSPSIIYLFSLITSTPLVTYSVRKLNSAYTGSALRIRRSSDNLESDIGFDDFGVLDKAAASSFVGGANAFVSAWYDQSGNGKDLSQSTQASQPRLVINGDSDSNNKPYIYLNEAAGHKLTGTATVNGITNAILGAVTAPVGSQSPGGNNVDNCILYVQESGSWGTCGLSVLAGTIAWRYGTGQSGNSNAISKTSSNTLQSAMVVKRNTTEAVIVNNVTLTTATGKVSPTSANTSALQVGGGDGGNCPNSKLCELLFFSTASSGDETVISLNQKTAFNL